jgi:adenylate kinase
MNIFVAGVHGVGKTYLASQLPAEYGLVHTSASKIIKAQMDHASWSADKRVNDVNANQIALIDGVRRFNDAGTRLLLDGHFVLRDAEGAFYPLDVQVFRSLNLDSVVLIETLPETIVARIQQRDDLPIDADYVGRFILAEREQAQSICKELGIPLHILMSPTLAAFSSTILAASSSNAA